MTEYLIEMNNASKFIQGKPIVYRLDLKIPRGTLYGLLGPNGAGKSTTIKLMTGRIKATSGEIKIFGKDPWSNRVSVNHNIGYLAQNSIQYQEKTVGDFMEYMGRLKGMPKSKARFDGREVLDQVGMGRFEQSKIGKLSGGERQRLGVANALLGDPDLLILDEPTASLDPAGRVYVMNLIQELANDKTKTVIISSHILPEIRRMTNHVAIMSEGSVLTSGNINELTRNIYDDEYEIRSDDPNRLMEILNSQGCTAEMERDRVYVSTNGQLMDFWRVLPKLCVDNGIELRSLVPVRDSLEKLFLQLVSKQQTAKEELERQQEERI